VNELSLFSGGGGGLLGTKLLRWKNIGYVENNDYCQRIITQRIRDGILDEAPIFGDIRAFLSDGYAEAYQGLVDVVTAGFPCQPFSVAGRQAGEDDPCNMWPETWESIRIIRPRYVFLENVPGLLAHKYIQRIFGDLAEGGYCMRWRCLSAAEVGAPHKRNRIRGAESMEEEHAASECGGWWETEPDVDRVAHGVASRVDRIEALGNGQVPAVVAAVWGLLV